MDLCKAWYDLLIYTCVDCAMSTSVPPVCLILYTINDITMSYSMRFLDNADDNIMNIINVSINSFDACVPVT